MEEIFHYHIHCSNLQFSFNQLLVAYKQIGTNKEKKMKKRREECVSGGSTGERQVIKSHKADSLLGIKK